MQVVMFAKKKMYIVLVLLVLPLAVKSVGNL